MTFLGLPAHFARSIPLNLVFGKNYTAWTCHLSASSSVLTNSPSVFLTKVTSSGRLSPVQVPAEYAAFPRFGLAAFHANEEVRAFRLFTLPVNNSTGSPDCEMWLSAVCSNGTPDQTGSLLPQNSFLPMFRGVVYLAAHLAPMNNNGSVIPLNMFVLPSTAVLHHRSGSGESPAAVQGHN